MTCMQCLRATFSPAKGAAGTLIARPIRPWRFIGGVATLFALGAGSMQAVSQVSFRSAIGLALQNSPQIKMAQDDVRRSVAVLAETEDLFIPSVTANGGAGSSYGITLTVPTILTVSAQSLVFSYSQRDYIRSARLGVTAATLSLRDTQEQVEEDAAVTYLMLDRAQKMARTLSETVGFGQRLLSIMQDRLNSGLESRLEVEQSRRTVLRLRLQSLQEEDEVAALQEHLGQLIGIPLDRFSTVEESIPALPPLISAEALRSIMPKDDFILRSAEANAIAKQERAFGDARYTWRPIVSMFAQYGRVSPINNVSQYYNLQGNYNTAAIGLQVQVPLLDANRQARARESMADASHARHEVEALRSRLTEDQAKLRRGLVELQVRAELAEADRAIAQEQLDAIVVQSKVGGFGGRVMTPRDAEEARIVERQRYADVLEAETQLQRSQIFLLRKLGQLTGWIESGHDVSRAEHGKAVYNQP